ncbi:aquaporin [Nocardia sp. NPDC050799]|uniref:aquaporin n=1 Tax=Nocardia sp. NPDC050799 TaxID=3154842 RepID=UPI0033D3422D
MARLPARGGATKSWADRHIAGLGPPGVAPASGLSLLLRVDAIGPVSGCHVNPAGTVGQCLMGRLSPVSAVGYLVVQVLGALVYGMLFGRSRDLEV